MALSKKNKPLNLAFLGCGFATRLHSKTLSGFKRDVHRYYASRNQDKAVAYNDKYKGSGYFGSYHAAIAHPNIDVVLVATPPAYHLDLTLQAMHAGKHVIVEKPPFLRVSDFDTIRQAQAETGSRVFVAENYFYKPLVFKLREIMDAGLIGEVLFIYINALKGQTTDDWRDDTALSGGGALFEGGIHWVNFIANLGLTVKSVRGLQPGSQKDVEKSMLVTIEYGEGAVGTLYYSREVPSLFKGLRISRIFGREGSITFESNGVFILVRGKQKRVIIPKLTDIAGYRAMFRDFLHALGTGESPQMSLDVAQRDLRLIETIYQSIND